MSETALQGNGNNHEASPVQDGIWRFDIVDTFEGKEQRFPKLMPILESNERIVMDHGSPNDPDSFHVTVNFDEQGHGKTILTLRHRIKPLDLNNPRDHT